MATASDSPPATEPGTLLSEPSPSTCLRQGPTNPLCLGCWPPIPTKIAQLAATQWSAPTAGTRGKT